jgi:hypothetical protein
MVLIDYNTTKEAIRTMPNSYKYKLLRQGIKLNFILLKTI